jgi:hypothetical protein
MKIEAGKYYKTQDGRRAFVSCLEPFTHLHPVIYIGVIEGEPDTSYRWDVNGVFCCNGSCTELNLVSEWVEPVQYTELVRLYRAGATYFAHIGDPHNDNAVLIGRKTITLKEGEFD